MTTRTAAIVLAAGSSTRLGQAKQLLHFAGQSLIRRTVDLAIESGCEPVIVVVAPGARDIANQLIDSPAIAAVNKWAHLGIGTSIRAGVNAIAADISIDAVLILLCDQPLVTMSLIERLAGAREQTNCSIAASRYGDVIGVPALFARGLFGELKGLPDISGAKLVIQRHPDQVVLVEFPEGAIDIDTPADLAVFDSL